MTADWPCDTKLCLSWLPPGHVFPPLPFRNHSALFSLYSLVLVPVIEFRGHA
jgi:hypothetical protein